jgi:hypothetical protein
MQRMFRMAFAATAVGALALLSGTPADARCSRMSASAVGLGPELAKDFAKMNVDAAITAKGMKPRGRTHYNCTGPFMSECTATRRAC